MPEFTDWAGFLVSSIPRGQFTRRRRRIRGPKRAGLDGSESYCDDSLAVTRRRRSGFRGGSGRNADQAYSAVDKLTTVAATARRIFLQTLIFLERDSFSRYYLALVSATFMATIEYPVEACVQHGIDRSRIAAILKHSGCTKRHSGAGQRGGRR